MKLGSSDAASSNKHNGTNIGTIFQILRQFGEFCVLLDDICQTVVDLISEIQLLIVSKSAGQRPAARARSPTDDNSSPMASGPSHVTKLA